jgi:hypothetical protein
MKIRKTLIALTFCILMALPQLSYAKERPPVPTDVPFEFDPNLCQSEVMDWAIAEPNLSIVYAVGAHNKWGLEIDFALSPSDPTTLVVVDKLGKAKDPEGGWNQYWQFSLTLPPIEKVHYINLVATDKAGRTDSRTLLIYAVFDDAPFLFPSEPLPVSRMKEAQKLWQVAMKKGTPMTKPTTVLN